MNLHWIFSWALSQLVGELRTNGRRKTVPSSCVLVALNGVNCQSDGGPTPRPVDAPLRHYADGQSSYASHPPPSTRAVQTSHLTLHFTNFSNDSPYQGQTDSYSLLLFHSANSLFVNPLYDTTVEPILEFFDTLLAIFNG